MSDYTKATNFAVKDSLPTTDPLKIITGTEHDDEYNAIAVAIATKQDSIHSTTEKTTIVDADELDMADSAAAYVGKRITWANVKTVLASTFTSLSLKDATGGYAGLTLFKINFKNAANTFTSFFTNSNTAARTYTFQDRDGTIADLTDIAGVSTATTKLPQISVTQAGGALTIAGIAKYLDFRSATLTSGTPSTVNADPADLVIPSGATLGSVTTVSARIIVVEMNNAGTSEYAVANISGGLQMDETNLISTTAIDTASDSASIWYSTTARSSLPYRVVACFDAVNTAGAWGNPTLVQPAGGNALMSMGSIGYGQTWQDVTGSRALSTTYYNTTAKPIQLAISLTSALYLVPTIGGVSLGNQAWKTSAIVPPGMSYSIASAGAISSWAELR